MSSAAPAGTPAGAPDGAASDKGRVTRAAAHLVVTLRWWVIGFWVIACVGTWFLLPPLGEAGGNDDLKGLVPVDTPAVATELRSVELFGFPLAGRTVVVQRDADGMSAFAQARSVVSAVDATTEATPPPGMENLRGALPVTNALGVFPGSRERGTTALTYLLFDGDVTLGVQTRTAKRYADRFFGPADDFVGVTGSVPARAEQGDLIREALPMVELFTLLAIVGIVGLSLRSVVAPIVAVVATGVAYVLVLRLSGAVAAAAGVATPSELEPVIVALLLGIVTDYTVFFLAGLRRQLGEGLPRLDAAREASLHFLPIVAVAGLAVAAGTAALVVAESPFFRALGPALVFTVVVGLVVALTLVPAVMAVLGRWCFWPGKVRTAARRRRPRRWSSLIAGLAHSRRRAGVVVALSVAGLCAAALPLLGLGLGVSFVGSLPADSGVRAAATAARTGFADGILSPSTVLLEGERLDQQRGSLAVLEELIEQQPGVAGVLGAGDIPRLLDEGVLVTDDGEAARLLVILDDPALGADGVDTMVDLQQRLPLLILISGLSDVSVGVAGDTAAAAYIVQQTKDDMLRIAVAALAANFLMLLLFLRAPVASLALLAGSVITLAASLGITSLVFEHFAPGAGLTFYVPFAAAVLLLAFGSDYNIYAVGNIWEETRRRPLPAAIIAVMPGTVATLMVAGLALAASFGLLGVVPLLSFRQLAFVMFLGILLDVLVVRSLLVPALLTLLGRAGAWPSKRLMARLEGVKTERD